MAKIVPNLEEHFINFPKMDIKNYEQIHDLLNVKVQSTSTESELDPFNTHSTATKNFFESVKTGLHAEFQRHVQSYIGEIYT